jgi:hypothetical protein
VLRVGSLRGGDAQFGLGYGPWFTRELQSVSGLVLTPRLKSPARLPSRENTRTIG